MKKMQWETSFDHSSKNWSANVFPHFTGRPGLMPWAVQCVWENLYFGVGAIQSCTSGLFAFFLWHHCGAEYAMEWTLAVCFFVEVFRNGIARWARSEGTRVIWGFSVQKEWLGWPVEGARGGGRPAEWSWLSMGIEVLVLHRPGVLLNWHFYSGIKVTNILDSSIFFGFFPLMCCWLHTSVES